MSSARDKMIELLKLVQATRTREIDCDQFLERVGALLERGLRDLPPDLIEAAQHLEVCPECHEEFEALLELHLEG